MNTAAYFARTSSLTGLTRTIGDSISNTDARDAAEDFFNQCYHFKDWRQKDTSFTLEQNVERHINNNAALRIAADYFNAFKHGGLENLSRSGDAIERINTDIKFDITSRGFVVSSRLKITVGGKSYDAFTLATVFVHAWDDFLRNNHISVPEA